MAKRRTATVRDLAGVLAGLRDADEVHDMLLALLTPREREELALRWRLVLLLQAGLTQRAIAARLGVSLCKITRGARELKAGPEGFRRVVKRVGVGESHERRTSNIEHRTAGGVRVAGLPPRRRSMLAFGF